MDAEGHGHLGAALELRHGFTLSSWRALCKNCLVRELRGRVVELGMGWGEQKLVLFRQEAESDWDDSPFSHIHLTSMQGTPPLTQALI